MLLAWKVSTEQQLSNIQINKLKGVNENVDAIYETIRSAALIIYGQYLSDGSEQKIELNQTVVKNLSLKLHNNQETPSELWFDELQSSIYEIFKVSNDFF